MSHLPTERLAALVDETPTAAEMSHLATCAECARERAAYRNLAELAAVETARIGSPLTRWELLAPALLADGVIDDGRGHVLRSRRARASSYRPWLQAAAALFLVAGGTVAGRFSAGASLLPATHAAAGATAATAAASAGLTDSAPLFRTVEEAKVAQAQSQMVYQAATVFLAARDTSGGGHVIDSPSAMRTRLAALDRARDVMGEALNAAPYDPVINGYYLNTLGQREATMRQLNTVMPASMRMMSY